MIGSNNDGATNSIQVLSNITVFNKYAKYKPEFGRRETWEELCQRNIDMHIKKYPSLASEITEVYSKFVLPKKVLPSLRSMQFAGKPIELSPNRIFNCCFVAIDDYRTFSEIMFLLLGGTGVGYSVQKNHVAKLPPVKKPAKTRRYVVGDSIEGWADAVKTLMAAYFNGKALPKFDFSDIRPKGAALVTSGGKAPGPEPLKDCIHNLQKILDRKKDGEQLTTLEVHDIVCFIADAVLAGGIRRAALIALFNIDDEDMLSCKFGNWYELNPQRARANNSAVIMRHRVKKNDFLNLWGKIRASGSGEPGIYFSNNAEYGTNPCCEVALRYAQFCNLVEMNLSNIESQEDLNARAKAAAFIATLQAGYTDFHYLRDIWKRTTEKEALIGVSGTGIASGAYKKCDLQEAAKVVTEENKRVAKIIGINTAARQTNVKPAGTSSLVFGTSSGIHSWFDNFYIRRMKLGKNEALYKYVKNKIPQLIEDDYFKPNLDAFITIPIAAPKGAIIAPTESAMQLLERIKFFSDNWVKPGHVKGDNSHNISATVYIKDHEWDEVGEWMWNNRDSYNGLAVLPFDGGTYTQAPHESITEEKYNELISYMTELDLSEVIEREDNTTQTSELACAGGVCEVQY